MYPKYGFGFTIVVPLLWTLYQNNCNKGYVLIIKWVFFFHHFTFFQNCICMFLFGCGGFFFCFFMFFLFTNYLLLKIGIDNIITKMIFRALADNTSLCTVNFYQDGNDCKGIALF